MFQFVTGNLLESSAYALVNAVNCEGCMGKGIAYQFRLRFPEMYAEYVKLCKAQELSPGKLHCFQTEDKLIINFPTKNKWRQKSKMEYIISGLDALIQVIREYDIPSIAIPSLGSGNGGLLWLDVKQVIVQKLEVISETMDILIYEPLGK